MVYLLPYEYFHQAFSLKYHDVYKTNYVHPSEKACSK